MPRVVGIDYGEKRVGLAVSDPTGTIALPLATLTLPDPAAAAGAVVKALAELKPPPDRIVVGLPISLDGSRGPMCAKVMAFVERLQTKITTPIDTQDERLTTSGVERMLIAADVRRDRRREVRDKLAAQSILQAYLDRPPVRPHLPSDGDGPSVQEKTNV